GGLKAEDRGFSRLCLPPLAVSLIRPLSFLIPGLPLPHNPGPEGASLPHHEGRGLTSLPVPPSMKRSLNETATRWAKSGRPGFLTAVSSAPGRFFDSASLLSYPGAPTSPQPRSRGRFAPSS